MAELGEATVAIRASFDKLDKDLKGAESKISKALGGLATGGAAAVTGALAGAGVAVTKFTSDSIKEFTSFQQGMNEVFTLLPGLSKEAMDSMSQDALDFAKDAGVLPEKLIPALYQAISAGVPKDNVFDFLGTAQKAAVGGVTDLETAVDGITSVVNAYGSDVISAAEASDLMFTAVKDGKTDFKQLSDSLFNVIPTASALGVEFSDITAALASMTAQGTPTSVATTQIRQLLVELSKEGSAASDTFKEISGQSFADFIAAGGNVQDALLKMEQKANDSGVSISNLFSSVEAGNAAIALTGGGTETFTKNLSDMQESAGATETAFDQMDGGIGRAQERAAAFWSNIKIGVGQALEPLITKVVELAEQALPKIEEIMKEAQPVIEKFAERFAEDLGPAVEATLSNVRGMGEAMGVVNEEMTDGEAVATTLSAVLSKFLDIVEGFTAKAEDFVSFWSDWGFAVKQILNPFGTLLDQIGDLDKKLQDLEGSLPEWMQFHSPTPLEMGIRGISDAMNSLPDFSKKFNFEPSFGGIGSAGMVDNSRSIGNINANATINSGGSVDEALTTAFKLLRAKVNEAGAGA